jgi:hypothetical protein
LHRRETGAARVSFRKPNCRSKMSSIPEKMEEKRIVMPTMPGARKLK